MTMRLYLNLALLFLLFISSCKKDNKVSPIVILRGSITGTITSVKGPLTNAKLTLKKEGGFSKEIIVNGSYLENGLPVGTYQVIASHDLYLSQSSSVTIEENKKSTCNFELEAGDPVLEVLQDSINAIPAQGSYSFSITSNSDWIISTAASWLSLEKQSGNGNEQVFVNVSENKSDSVRTAEIIVSNGILNKKLVVTQDVKLKIISVSLTKPISDSITVVFNKPALVSSIKSLYSLCLTTISFRYLSENKGIRLKYSCARLGLSYPFELVANDNGSTVTLPFTADFFTQKIAYPEIFSDGIPTYFITDDNKSLWFAIYNSKKIQKIDINDFKVEKEYSYDFVVRKLCYNPYNKLIYILSNTANIYVMNPASGEIVKNIAVNVLPEDNRIYPMTIPRDLAFTISGKGGLICGHEGSSGSAWKMIDSSNDDIIYYDPDKDRLMQYGMVLANQDRSQLYLLAGYSNDILQYDVSNGSIKEIKNPVSGRLGWITPNKKNGNLLFIQTYEQYLYNPNNGYVSKVSYLAHGGKGDFYYGASGSEIVFMFDTDNYFQVLDYKTASTYLVFPCRGDMYYTTPLTSTNGKWLICHSNYTLYKFDTELFYKSSISKIAASKVSNKSFSRLR